MPSPEEQERDCRLVEAMARGDRPALAELYEHHASRLLALLRHLLGRGSGAEDVLQDVFLEAWRRASTYSPERGSVSAWLSLRARSRALDLLRSAHRNRTRSITDDLLRQLRDPAANPARTTEYGKLKDVLDQMASEEREVIVLGYFGDLSSTEIAATLGIPVGTVKSRTRSGLRKLRTYFGGGC